MRILSRVVRARSSSSVTRVAAAEDDPAVASSARRKISRSRRLRQQGRIRKSSEELKEENTRLYVRFCTGLHSLIVV